MAFNSFGLRCLKRLMSTKVNFQLVSHNYSKNHDQFFNIRDILGGNFEIFADW